MPPKLKDVVEKCLMPKPRDRISPHDIIECPWFKEMKGLVFVQMKKYVI